jgi:ferritin-like metal-binding protein YciE
MPQTRERIMTQNINALITSYVTDMVALEEHLAKALAGQIEDLNGEDQSVTALREIQRRCERHITVLDALADRRKASGHGISEAIKRAGSAVLGAGAAAIDFVRSEKVPKNLRDDYTAVSMACIGYVMLHTTALSTGDSEVAGLAHELLGEHAKSVMLLHNVVPGAVIRFLQEEGYPARTDVLTQIASNIESVWRDDESTPSADELAPARGRA